MRNRAIGIVCAALGVTAVGCGGSTVPLGTAGAPSDTDGGGTGGASTGGGSPGGTGGASSGGTGGGASGGASGGTAGQGGSGGIIEDPVQEKSSKLDVLLVVDNSLSMGDHQALFRRAADELIRRLVNPRCLDAQGNLGSPQPAGPEAACPAGTTRESVPVRDMNIGVITSSLGGHGADTCSPEEGSTWNPTKNDQAHLIGSVRFARWDPQGNGNPVGTANVEELAQIVEAQLLTVGSLGCGFEAPLEAAYRFLVDPDPPGAVIKDPSNTNFAIVQGVDQTVLEQRSMFLRPDSAVLVVILSDENDCSIVDGGINWLSMQALFPGSSTEFRLPRATSVCATDPNNLCCRSCGLDESGGPPPGCAPLNQDPVCLQGPYDRLGDGLSLRCWHQRERFGLDFHYAIERYVAGFDRPMIPNRRGESVQNPLFAGGRHPSLVSVAAIVGVPWQDLARAPTGERLEFLSWRELRDLNRWPVIVGDPSRHVPPGDPYMHEEVDPRSGTNPITGDPIAPPSAPGLASPINGREVLMPERNDLQTACITALPEPRECLGNPPPPGCPCVEPNIGPWCQGTLQTHSKAYPGIRELEFVRRLGSRAVSASLCSRNATDLSRQDYGYRPAMQAIVERMQLVLR